ncbi:hypothetical protein VTL71DRAFT_1916 [Oculimacula yallundae]|uniref:Polyketide synthase n=1 Tax=Oculimacula yallundae TaxID=86028 RepID=A0ABR4CDF4_9HELO
MVPSLVLCGPQVNLPSSKYLSQIRQSLLNHGFLHEFLAAIDDLPRLWGILIEYEPQLSSVPGLECIEAIKTWLSEGVALNPPREALNVFFTPLTVIFHIVEYMTFIQTNGEGITHSSILETAKSAGIQGFCTGFLTAAALSLSEDEDDICTFGGVALRLALCIGAFIDLAGPFSRSTLETSCLSVRLRDLEKRNIINEIVAKHTNAYVSVISDKNTYTITVPKTNQRELSQSFSEQNIVAKTLALEGLFHSQNNEKIEQRLLAFVATQKELQFPDASRLFLPLRSNTTGQVIETGNLEQIAAKSLLVEMSDWNSTITNAIASLEERPSSPLLTIGPLPTISVSTIRDAPIKLSLRSGTQFLLRSQIDATTSVPLISTDSEYHYPEDSIAIVGMACRFPGASSLEEFWEVIKSGVSMVGPVPLQRFSTENLRRSGTNKSQFFGNFVQDADAFDHKFFKKSPREAQSLDPQQRFLLEVTYDALLSSGHFGDLHNTDAEDDTGCFLGIGSLDYNDNIASHPANAFSAVGTLRAFLSGRLSHYFGWTGPSMTYDTACSSSAVAIHAACKELAAGRCSRAVAGGVNLITSPALYQNLAAANFLSPTGACKSFDAAADGYCRGEGVGLVVLKRLVDAKANGDNIMGVIVGSAVNQSSNASPITVPHTASQVALYEKVARLARINPFDVSYCEAHGTGTPVGDPIECESIRKAFAGPERHSTIFLGSVKANIGHAEAASGAAALIKTVLMLQHKSIPVQANFKTLNPKIPTLKPDKMTIARSTQAWNNSFRAACINNYGAAGSNAAMIVCQPPPLSQRIPEPQTAAHRYPIIISAHTENSLKKYCEVLRAQISRSPIYSVAETLSSIAFNLATKQNRQLSRKIVTSAATISELSSKLSNPNPVQNVRAAKPVVLVFSGQTSDHVGLSETVYSSSRLFRRHLDDCNKAMAALNLPDLLPGIFSKEPVLNIVSLHCMLFSYQYASAMSWIDSGLRVDRLVGHSFGQLTALCVSGTLSLMDTIKMISGRAALIEKYWGDEKGSMLYLEGTSSAVERLLGSLDQEAEISGFNSPTGFVVSGSKAGINSIEKYLAEAMQDYGISRSKRLSTTHAFHSKYTEPLLDKISALAEELTFQEPKIPVETCTEGHSWTKVGPIQLSQHTRYPVYFSEAIARITDQLGACTWVGIGPGSTIINMVSRALGQSASETHSFQAVQLESKDSMDSLAEATSNLWKLGHLVQFWPFHKSQRDEYTPINLPPYQFEKSRHWVDYIDSIEVSASTHVTAPDEKISLLSPIKDPSQPAGDATFLVAQNSDEFALLASGHAVLGQPLCPASLYLELAVRGAQMTQLDTSNAGHDTSIENLEIKAPLGLDKNRFIKLTLNRASGATSCWNFQLSSQSLVKASSRWIVHATGTVSSSPRSAGISSTEFRRFARLIDHDQYCALMADEDGESMQGKVIYKVFDPIVKYADYYRGVKSISSKGNKVAGLVELGGNKKPQLASCAMDPIAIDTFLQVAGLHVNSLLPCGDDEVYVATQVETIRFGQEIAASVFARTWNVYSTCARENPKEVVNDIFVFDPVTKNLEMVILGAHFTKVLKPALSRALATANPDTVLIPSAMSNETACGIKPTDDFVTDRAVSEADNSQSLGNAVREILSKLIDVSVEEINNDASFEDIGIDSLMVNEVLSELHQILDVEIPFDDFQQLRDIGALINYIQDRLPLSTDDCSTSSKTGTPMTILSTTSLDSSDNEILKIKLVPMADPTMLAHFLGGQLDIPASDIKDDSILSEIGVDSLLTTEIVDGIEKTFGVHVDQGAIIPETTFGQLCSMVLGPTAMSSVTGTTNLRTVPVADPPQQMEVRIAASGGALPDKDLLSPAELFDQKIRFHYDQKAEITKFSNFWTKVYPAQRRLVTAYTVEAFKLLGCSLASLTPGQQIFPPPILAKHTQCMGQLLQVLEEAGCIESQNGRFVRTSTTIDPVGSQAILDELLQGYPQHVSEHKLLQITGSQLGQCLSGAADPIQLIFRNKATKDLLADVYTHAPMFEAGTFLLGDFLSEAFAAHRRGKLVRILELGGGTGGTTSYIANHLVSLGIKFIYTFTDLSPSLVAAAKKKFASYDSFEYMVLDIEKTPPAKLHGQYDVVISTNCIHATKNLINSLTNIRKTLSPTGFVSLVELTRNIPWFDLVFGLLEGWWLFNDGRKHALADVSVWDKSMKAAGFKTVRWSEGTPEAATLRVIVGFQEASKAASSNSAARRMVIETVTYKETESNLLQADIYYPAEPEVNEKRPVALMIHGGGHIMLSRKDVRRKQTRYLFDHGFLPVSIDYRLCPEINILDGPIADVRDALGWVRNELPRQKLKCSGLRIDGENVVVVGWSTGGLLAMTLAWTAPRHNIWAPEAILAFYCPTDYQDPCWRKPNFPKGLDPSSLGEYDLFEGVYEQPINSYNVPPSQRAIGGWLSGSDPRSRIALHMNWKGQALPILLGGLPSKTQLNQNSDLAKSLYEMPQPDDELIASISPYAQILKGNYRTPTFLIHGKKDDLIPWQQTVRVQEALAEKGVSCEARILDDAIHLFDLSEKEDCVEWKAVLEGYNFLFSFVGTP